MSSAGSITPLPLDPELLGALVEKLPTEVIEQLTHNWQKQTEALARSEKENRLLRELLRLMRVEKYGPSKGQVARSAGRSAHALFATPVTLPCTLLDGCGELGHDRTFSAAEARIFRTVLLRSIGGELGSAP